jgi:hypothetical protein
MALTILQLVQEFCDLRGLPTPTAVLGSGEKSVKQYQAILKKVSRKLQGYRWNSQKLQRTFTTVAAVDQGELLTLFGSDFEAFAPMTLWNTSRKLMIGTPVMNSEWALTQALELSGPPFKCWLANGHFYLDPAPEAGETISAIIWVKNGFFDGSVSLEEPDDDGNTFLYPDDVVLAGFEAYWKKQKGEPWGDDYNEFLSLIAKRKVSDGLPRLSLEAPDFKQSPGVFIPPGSWPV